LVSARPTGGTAIPTDVTTTKDLAMPTMPLGALNPALLAQCPTRPVPENAQRLPIHVTIWGDGPRVFMVHGGVQGGIGGGPVNFQGQKPLAARGWRIELIDRPGFGDSPSRGPDDMAADAVLIADHLGDGCHLVGHSFGGAEALLAAARRPEATRSLILIEPALQPLLVVEDPTGPGARAAANVVMKFLLTAQTPAEFAETFARSMGRTESGEINVSAANIAGDAARATALGCSLLQARAVSPTEMLAAAQAVKAAAIPTLVISGGYSDGQAATADTVARVTGGRHVIVSCSSHFVQQANPEEFNRVADAFWREADAA
jgi:pimeloyl-ACP methyl ester carboxylesterase